MSDFQDKLKKKMDEYTHLVYRITKKFPKEELYGVVSQIRRSSLSVILNYIEGYARRRPTPRLQFLNISYGSLKESKYLLHFSKVERYLSEKEYVHGVKLADEIVAMLWTEIKALEKNK